MQAPNPSRRLRRESSASNEVIPLPTRIGVSRESLTQCPVSSRHLGRFLYRITKGLSSGEAPTCYDSVNYSEAVTVFFAATPRSSADCSLSATLLVRNGFGRVLVLLRALTSPLLPWSPSLRISDCGLEAEDESAIRNRRSGITGRGPDGSYRSEAGRGCSCGANGQTA